MYELVKVVIVLLLLALFVMLLWNWVMVDIFKLPAINYLQALGLWLLSKLLIHRIDVKND